MTGSRAQRLATLFWRWFPRIMVEPPLVSIIKNSETRSRKIIRDFISSQAPSFQGKVIDIGAGNETFTRGLCKDLCDYVSVDCVASANVDVVCDIKDLTRSFAPQSCDFVICTDVLEHVQDLHESVSAIRAVLKQGGKLLLTVPFNYKLHGNTSCRDYWRISEDGLGYLLRDFSQLKITAHGNKQFPFSYTVIAQK